MDGVGPLRCEERDGGEEEKDVLVVVPHPTERGHESVQYTIVSNTETV